MSSGGGVAVRAYDGKVSIVRQVGEVLFTVPWELPGKIRSHAMLVIVVKVYKPGKGGVGLVKKKSPKDLSVKCHELTSRVSLPNV